MEIEMENFDRHASALASRMDSFDWAPTLGGDVKREVLQGIRDNFTSSRSPDGKRWKPRKHKGDGHPLLIDTGRMMQAATGGGAGRIQQVDGAELTVGVNTSSVKYAGYHNDGTKTLPQREYMGVQTKRLRKIDDVIADDGMGMFDV